MFEKGPSGLAERLWWPPPGPAPGPSGSPTVGRGRLDLTGLWSVDRFSESVRDGMPSGMLCGI